MVLPLTAEDAHVRERIAALARDAHGRLVAVLAAADRDIAAAEDAVSDAVERALLRWPADGVPANPEAWLLVVARNRMRDRWKSAAHRSTVALDENDYETIEYDAPMDIPDRRLALLMVCAKKRIRDAGIPFVVPERERLAERLPAALEAVYGAYAIDWQRGGGSDGTDSLAGEALHLALILAELLPGHAEVLGLAALI